MWHAADLAERLKFAAPGYKFGPQNAQFNWGEFKTQRDAYVRRLNGIYANNFDREGVEFHHGRARFLSPTEVEVTRPEGKGTYILKADHITVAVGGEPTIPSDEEIPGASLGITSDGFFALEEQPKRVAVVGAGYIAVELAGIFNALGSETHLLIRGETVLRTFDPVIQETLTPWMEKTGIKVHRGTHVKRVDGTPGGPLKVTTNEGEVIEVDTLLWAIGRKPSTYDLGLDKANVKVDHKGDIVVDEFQNTSTKGVYAIGDVQGKALLTPVAIAAGRRLSNRLFGGEKYKNEKLDYENIPSVVFS